MIVPAQRVEKETLVHPANPRNQEALTDDYSVRDILKQIEERGVDTEGIAVKKRWGLFINRRKSQTFLLYKGRKGSPPVGTTG
uniref:hypothetical protein n=1 Tax=Escherichia coli TaxID=562 RepID=UPI002035BE35|nr:hypothetical protein [Escherichia coli]